MIIYIYEQADLTGKNGKHKNSRGKDNHDFYDFFSFGGKRLNRFESEWDVFLSLSGLAVQTWKRAVYLSFAA